MPRDKIPEDIPPELLESSVLRLDGWCHDGCPLCGYDGLWADYSDVGSLHTRNLEWRREIWRKFARAVNEHLRD